MQLPRFLHHRQALGALARRGRSAPGGRILGIRRPKQRLKEVAVGTDLDLPMTVLFVMPGPQQHVK